MTSVFSFGLPRQVDCDKGPQFVSAEFEKFMKENGVKHLHSAPYHPASKKICQSLKQVLEVEERQGVRTEPAMFGKVSTNVLCYTIQPQMRHPVNC